MNSKEKLQRQNAQRLDRVEHQSLVLEQSYPCPICRQGQIEPITLTEAWGCDRCRQIFERRAESNTIGKLSAPYYRQRSWRWDGKQWVLVGKIVRPKSFNVATATALGFLLWIVLSRIDLSGISSIFLLGVTVAILFLVVMFWVLRRR